MKTTNKNNLPIQFLNAVNNDDYDGPKATNKNVFSVTTLLDSPYIKSMKAKYYDQIEEDVADKIWLLLGKGVHTVLESGARPGDLFEERLYHKINVDGVEVTITGAFDYFNMLTKTIQDYKTTSVYVRKNAERLFEYRMQLLIYAWLLFHCKGIAVRGIENIMIYKDYSKAKKNAPANVEVIKHEMMDLRKIEEFIVDQVRYHLSEPIECTPHERWYKEGQLAVMKEGRKSALKCFKESELEAATEFMGEKKGHYIELRPGASGRCEFYCSCKEFCPQYKAELKESGNKIIKKVGE